MAANIAGMRMLTLISLAAGAYVFLRAVMPLRCGWLWKVALGVGIVLVASFYKVLRLIGGDLPFAPDLPAWLQLSYSCLYMTLIAYFVVLLVAHLVRLSVAAVSPAWRALEAETKRSLGNVSHLAMLLGVMAMVGVGVVHALMPPEPHEVPLCLPVSKPLRVAVLTDLHVDAVKDRAFMQDVVERTNALEPDIVLIVGDFADGRVAQRGAHLEPLRDLKAPVYGVPGNHEYYSGYDEWNQFLATLGIRMLNNEHVLLEDYGVALAGVTDPAARVFDREQPDVQKAVAGVPSGMPIILMAHQPQIAAQAEPAGVALQVSGHTHGGLMPGLAQLTARYNLGFVNGLYHAGRMLLYVSPGTSLWSGIPLRLGVPAEISLITIDRPDKG